MDDVYKLFVEPNNLADAMANICKKILSLTFEGDLKSISYYI